MHGGNVSWFLTDVQENIITKSADGHFNIFVVSSFHVLSQTIR